MIKNENRAFFKEIRKNVLNKEFKSIDACENLYKLVCNLKIKDILVFSSINDEINTMPFILKALDKKLNIYFPLCIDKKGKLEFFKIENLSSLNKGNFGVLEPKYEKENIYDKNLSNSLILVPGLGFSKEGYRIGYGKGYYDRYLKNFNGYKVGFCFSQQVGNVIYENFDEKLDIIITENEVIDIGKTL